MMRGGLKYFDKDVQARSHVINLQWGDVAFDEDYEDTTLENEGDYIKNTCFRNLWNISQKR